MTCPRSLLRAAFILQLSMQNTVEIEGTNTERRVKTSAGGVSGTAYVQVIPRNTPADDLPRVKDVLTGGDLPYVDSAIEITGISTTTECTRRQQGNQCECQPGFLFDGAKCGAYASCYVPLEIDSYCVCAHLNSSSAAYCEQPPAIPGRVTLFPSTVTAGSDVRLDFSSSEDVTNVRWYMVNLLWNLVKEVHDGTRASVVTSRRGSTLSIRDIPRNWEGLYVCRFKYQNLHWQASHLVKFPLQVLDITRNPPQVLLWNNSTMFPGTTVECCIWDDGISYHVFWEPGHIPSGVVKRGGQQCYTLSIESIPENDTHFRCVFQDNMNKAVESGVRVDVVQVKDIFCSDDGDNMWKATKVGREAEILCPNGKKGRITRSCLRNGQWGIPKTTCMDARLLSVLDQAERLRGGLGLPEQEISEMIARLRNHITSIQTFDAGDIITVVDTIKTLSLTATDNNIQFNSTTMADFVAVFSLVLDYDSETTWITARIEHPFIGSNFMQSVENITKLFETNWNNYTLVQPNVQLSVVVLSPSSLTSYNKTFDTTPTVEVSMKNIDFPDHMDINKVTVTNMVLRNLAKILPMNFGDSIEGYWHNVESHIVMNTIMMSNQSLRQVNVDMVFVHGKVHNRTDAQCVFWDYSLFEGVGGWSTDGCRTFRQDSYTVCRCTHLTAFSVLMSLGVLTDDYLETLSEIGVILSIICLTISIIIYIAEWKSVVKNDISFFRQTAMINISLSLLIGDTWFLSSTFMEESHTNKLCISAAFFQHLFYLATFFWMLVHGLILFHQLVFVFHQLIKSIVIPAMVAIGYVCPLIIASVTISIDYPKAAYIKEGACFINGDNGAIFAFSGPVLLIVFVNFFIIGVVIWKLLRPSVSEGQQEDRKALVAKALIILTSVFGITWILGTATLIEEAHEFFHYAFTVLNSLQGVFILLFVCLLDKKVTGALSKRFQNLKTLNSSMTCCGENSYNMDSSNEPESVETYNAIEDS